MQLRKAAGLKRLYHSTRARCFNRETNSNTKLKNFFNAKTHTLELTSYFRWFILLPLHEKFGALLPPPIFPPPDCTNEKKTSALTWSRSHPSVSAKHDAVGHALQQAGYLVRKPCTSADQNRSKQKKSKACKRALAGRFTLSQNGYGSYINHGVHRILQKKHRPKKKNAFSNFSGSMCAKKNPEKKKAATSIGCDRLFIGGA